MEMWPVEFCGTTKDNNGKIMFQYIDYEKMKAQE